MWDGEDVPGARRGDAGATPPATRLLLRSGHGGGRPHVSPPPRAAPPPPLPNAPPAEADTADALLPAGLSGEDRVSRIAALRGLVQGRLRPAKEAAAGAASWRLGAAAVDRWLGAGGLEAAGVHELKPDSAAAEDRAAAAFFALALARRRLDAGSSHQRGRDAAWPSILWCEPRSDAAEIGRLHAPGLAALGLDFRQFVIASTRRAEDTLWAAEEGLRSGALSLVVVMVAQAALTPARRLALAAERSGTPCLLLSSARAATAATATRWRIARAPAAPHPFDARSPGVARLAVTLERCRGQPLAAARSFVVEWSHASVRFDLVPGFRDAAAAAGGDGDLATGAMAGAGRRSSAGRS